MKRSSQIQPPKTALAPRRDLFKPGFTVVANTLLDNCELRLSRSQQLFLNWTLRSTTGRQREWCPLKMAAVAASLQMSDTACYGSRDALQAKQVVEVREDVDGLHWVRLTPRFQPLRTELLDPDQLPRFPGTFPESGNPTSPKSGQLLPEIGNDSCSNQPLRKKKERKEKQQEQNKKALEPTPASLSPLSSPVVVVVMQSTGGTTLTANSSFSFEPVQLGTNSTSQPCAPAAPPTAPALPAPSQAPASPPSASEVPIKTVLTTEQEAQARLLRQHGVAGPQSVKLALLHSVEAIARALDDLGRQTSVCKSGAWLFSGLSSGRYQHEPEAATQLLPAPTSEAEQVPQREVRRPASLDREAVLEARRQREAEKDRTERLWQDRQLERDLAALEQLPPAEYQHLEKLARASLGKREPSRSLLLGAMLSLRQSKSSVS